MRGKGTARVILVTVAVRRGGMLGAPVLRGAVHDLGRPRRREVFSFDDLQKAPKKTTGWDNVRNSTAHNFLRDGMKLGDLMFFYHSNDEPSAIVGIAEVVRGGYPDPGAFDKSHEYHDPKSNPDAPTWFMLDVRAVELPRPVTLPEIKARQRTVADGAGEAGALVGDASDGEGVGAAIQLGFASSCRRAESRIPSRLSIKA